MEIKVTTGTRPSCPGIQTFLPSKWDAIMQRGVISAKSICTARMQGPARRVPAMPVTVTIWLAALRTVRLLYGTRNTRRLVAWEDEIAVKCICSFIKQLHYWPSSITHYHPPFNSYPITSPASCSSAKSPPAFTTARSAAWLNLRRFSTASLSRRALVLLLPDGATPVNSFSLSDGV